MYMQPVSERATLPSEKEIAHRKLFSEASQYVKTLSEEQRKAYAEAWKKDDYQFNGKRYSTLQGYIIARCYKNSKLVNVS